MLHDLLRSRLLRTLQRAADTPRMPWVAGLLACALTVSMTLPVTWAMVPAVLLAPRQWRGIVICSAAGSALGATVLVSAFHHLGWAQVYALFPDIARSARWQEVMQWARDYGVLALSGIAALPLPQTPALVFAAITRQPELEIALAVLVGKLIKYGVIGAAVVRFPHWFHQVATALPPLGRR
jgi:membrane protein YqaA with SNARE-associated domain